MWAMCLGDWHSVGRLSGYVTRVCELNIEQSKENRAWLLILAAVLRDDSFADFQAERGLIAASRGKREKLLLRLLEAILDPPSADLEAATSDYFRHYVKFESKREFLDSKVAIDGTILAHFAEKRGTPLPLPASLTDYIVRL